MTHLKSVLLALFGAASLVIGSAAIAAAHSSHDIVVFDSMTPVTGAAVGAVNDRGITGGGKPWVITSGSGEVDRDGTVHVTVQGLIIPASAGFGFNPVKMFGATVSCITPDGVVNLRTATAPATTSGDSTIDGSVSLPHPCKDPILFVTSPGGAWFAMSNPADEEED
ncbi:MAG TPA: hypothetical protein VGV88_00215 [Candidatus Dormibacteraeota bacterium]|nr:hypothetical protein [Candidatus Dormibacteraeota bacterium]